MATLGISLTKIAHQCAHCHNQFFPKRTDRLTFCSRECAFACKAARRRSTAGKAKAFYLPKVQTARPCIICGSEFMAFGGRARYCTPKCREIAAERRRAPHRLLPRICRECGASFKPAYGNKARTYCSDECGKRAGKRPARIARKARQRLVTVEAVNPMKVFERDDWRCQLCGVTTPRKLRGQLVDRAPELDHIIPLSRGGEHSYRNTQCACRRCNAAKSDGAGGQMRLFG